jgi:hypothetical protein
MSGERTGKVDRCGHRTNRDRRRREGGLATNQRRLRLSAREDGLTVEHLTHILDTLQGSQTLLDLCRQTGHPGPWRGEADHPWNPKSGNASRKFLARHWSRSRPAFLQQACGAERELFAKPAA